MALASVSVKSAMTSGRTGGSVFREKKEVKKQEVTPPSPPQIIITPVTSPTYMQPMIFAPAPMAPPPPLVALPDLAIFVAIVFSLCVFYMRRF